MGNIFQNRNAAVFQSIALDSITLGTVISNSDPHQMGRLKINCQGLGDNTDDATGETLPWATMMSSFGGMTNSSVKRGPNEGVSSKGPIAYGMWNIPSVGSTVVVACIDGDPYYRIWMGSIFDQGAINTLPHGRYFYDDEDGDPEGPLDSYEEPIEPLYSNQEAAFTTKTSNYEWRTRGADYSVAGNPEEFLDYAPSNYPDEVVSTPFESDDGLKFDIKNGYAAGRGEGQEKTDASSVFSWTTPGFHSISMDDRAENCRIRVRTTCGTQLLMDDTNERIYISTAQGENWLEMDYNGNIDMFGRRVSVHSTKDMNFTSEETIRMYGKTGIHLVSPEVINMHATKDISMVSDLNFRLKTAKSIFTEAGEATNMKTTKDFTMETDATANIKAKKDVKVEADSNANIKAGKKVNIQSESDTNMKATGKIIQTGSQIEVNGTPAGSADASGKAVEAKPAKAMWTNRIPIHEPFTRTMTKDDFSHEPELEYDDPNVGKMERGDEIERGTLWRR